MLNVQRYLKTEKNTLESLKETFGITFNDYDDIVTLNYNQIDSPRFHPICDECRGLILEKGSWDIVARSFQRFYNIGEGHNKGNGFLRVPSFLNQENKDNQENHTVIPFDLVRATAVEKLDGSLITAYWYNYQWNFSTRKMAFAEGQTTFGVTFAELIKTASNYQDIMSLLHSFNNAKRMCWVFELTSPANRIVTPYSDTKMNLIAVVHKETGIELNYQALKDITVNTSITIPYMVETSSWEDLIQAVQDMPSMEEGIVLVLDDENFVAPLRIKVKNPKFVAIAHMRENGGISPKNVLRLVMLDEQAEYLSYFPDDKPYFDLVNDVYAKFASEILQIYDNTKDIQEQKEFALTIQEVVTNKAQCGFLFKMRKGDSLGDLLKQTEPKKLAEVLNLKTEFVKMFGNVIEEEN